MYFEVAASVAVSSAALAYSRAVPVEGANAVRVEVNALYVPAGSVIVSLQESNDDENWKDISGTSITLNTTTLYGSATWSGIASRFVRVKYQAQSASVSVVSVGANTAAL